MGSGSDLEVDVNGEEMFLVSKEILSTSSGRLRNLFGKPAAEMLASRRIKVLFHDFPGGAEAFELIARFCYNPGSISVTPSNVCLLHCAAHFMEMTEAISNSPNLIDQTVKSLDGVAYWTWPEILFALRTCQHLSPALQLTELLKKILGSLLSRIASAIDTSPSTSSPDSSGFRFSCDTRSTESTRNGYHRYWWFEDLAGFDTWITEKIVEGMISGKFEQAVVSKFLFYYFKSQVPNAKLNEKPKIIETVTNLLFSLDRDSVSCKGLFFMLRVVLGVNVGKCCRNRLESMIGSQLDRATLDNLLVPSPVGVNLWYDVNLVIRFLKSFLSSSSLHCSTKLRRVGMLLDMYISEVAPDTCLKPSKFIALLLALPDSARETYDGIYRAIDMYLEVHSGLSENEKLQICCALNYEKLSLETFKHLAQNSSFPTRITIQALLSEQSKLKSLLQDTDYQRSSNSSNQPSAKNHDEQTVLYAKKLNLTEENENIKALVQGMHWRVMELEKVCKKLQIQMAKIMKTKLSIPSNPKSLPRLCS